MVELLDETMSGPELEPGSAVLLKARPTCYNTAQLTMYIGKKETIDGPSVNDTCLHLHPFWAANVYILPSAVPSFCRCMHHQTPLDLMAPILLPCSRISVAPRRCP
jgi:hypothetical protein